MLDIMQMKILAANFSGNPIESSQSEESLPEKITPLKPPKIHWKDKNMELKITCGSFCVVGLGSIPTTLLYLNGLSGMSILLSLGLGSSIITSSLASYFYLIDKGQGKPLA